jgi:hypothetical protein
MDVGRALFIMHAFIEWANVLRLSVFRWLPLGQNFRKFAPAPMLLELSHALAPTIELKVISMTASCECRKFNL